MPGEVVRKSDDSYQDSVVTFYMRTPIRRSTDSKGKIHKGKNRVISRVDGALRSLPSRYDQRTRKSKQKPVALGSGTTEEDEKEKDANLNEPNMRLLIPPNRTDIENKYVGKVFHFIEHKNALRSLFLV